MRLAVEIGALKLKNPVIAASGTFGYGVEVASVTELSRLGGIVTKGLYLEPREGCPTPRVAETPSGLLNAIGLQGVGVKAFVREVLPRLAEHDTAVIVNVCGDTVREYADVSSILDATAGVSALEINISCPNVERGGLQFGIDARMTHEVVAAVRKATSLPIIPKLSPNVTDITVFARAAEEAGADALSCVNTLLGLAVDIQTRRPKLAFGTGGLSGPAIRPVALRLAWQAVQAVSIPVIGIGGIAETPDALEFLMAGCRAVQVGTANFVDPAAGAGIVAGLEDYLEREGLASIGEVIGTLQMPRREPTAAPG